MCSVCVPKGRSRGVTVPTLGPQAKHRVCKYNIRDATSSLQVSELTDKQPEGSHKPRPSGLSTVMSSAAPAGDAQQAAAAAVDRDTYVDQAGDTSWVTTVREACKHCSGEDFQQGCGPRALLMCGCCQSGAAHVECEIGAVGAAPAGDSDWFCCQVSTWYKQQQQNQKLSSG